MARRSEQMGLYTNDQNRVSEPRGRCAPPSPGLPEVAWPERMLASGILTLSSSCPCSPQDSCSWPSMAARALALPKPLGAATWREMRKKGQVHELGALLESYLDWHPVPMYKMHHRNMQFNYHGGHTDRLTLAARTQAIAPGASSLPLTASQPASLLPSERSCCPDFFACFSVLCQLNYTAYIL